MLNLILIIIYIYIYIMEPDPKLLSLLEKVNNPIEKLTISMMVEVLH